MRAGKSRFFGAGIVLLFVCVAFTNFISSTSAALVKSDIVYITGNDPDNSTGSFKVQVDYKVYDGTSASDPIGVTNDAQIAFLLTHLGGDGIETPVLKFGRFTVYAPDPWAETAFYTHIYALGDTGRAPRLMDIDPPTTLPNVAEFFFNTSISQGSLPQFEAGETSRLLVVRTLASNIPATILLEIDYTNAIPDIDGDATITVPEPCSILVFGGAFCLCSLLHHKNRKH